MQQGTIEDRERRRQLQAAAEGYFRGLEQGDFHAIPFAENVELRAPLAPGGAHRPLVGKKTLEEVWWAPLQGAIGKVEIVDHFFNEAGNGICTEALVSIAGTDIVLRVADRFTVDASGLITAQENHFDPRDVTTPGWATASGD